MERSDVLKRKLASTQDLHSVVRTMKSLAAVNIAHFQRAARSVESYMENVEESFAALTVGMDPETLISMPDLERTGIVVFGSAHGLCGQFNQEIVRFTLESLESYGIGPGQRSFLVLGNRARSRLLRADASPDRYLDISGSMSEVPRLMRQALSIIEEWTTNGIERVYLFYNRTESKASFSSEVKLLLPLDPNWVSEVIRRGWQGKVEPVTDIERSEGLQHVSRHYFYGTMYRAFLESMASENASRLAAMQAAESNIEDQLDELQSQYNRMRQTAITGELLDITAGFEALTGE